MITSAKRRATAGSALIMAVVISGIAFLGLASLMNVALSERSIVARADAYQTAIFLAESGIDEALAHINVNNDIVMDGWSLDALAGTCSKTRSLSGGYYVVRITLLKPPIVTSTGCAVAPITGKCMSRTVQVRTRLKPTFTPGLIGLQEISFSGAGVVDSFDSRDPQFSTAGSYDPVKARDRAVVVLAAPLSASMSLGNRSIYGYVRSGSGIVPSLGNNGAVGSSAWVNNPLNGGQIEPGHWLTDATTNFPPVVLPAGSARAPRAGTVKATNYVYVLTEGDFALGTLSMDGDDAIIVTGHATLYVTNSVSMKGNSLFYVQRGASVKLYCPGDIDVGGGGVFNESGAAGNFAIYGLSDDPSTEVTIRGNVTFVGQVFAPNQRISLAGASEFIGGVVGSSVTISGGGGFHYDEALGTTYVIKEWIEL